MLNSRLLNIAPMHYARCVCEVSFLLHTEFEPNAFEEFMPGKPKKKPPYA